MVVHSVKDEMISEAQFGKFYILRKLTSSEADIYRKEGFLVIDTHNVKYFPRVYKISWEHAVVTSSNINLLDVNSDKYSFAQKLWITSMRNKNKWTNK